MSLGIQVYACVKYILYPFRNINWLTTTILKWMEYFFKLKRREYLGKCQVNLPSLACENTIF
jgi:hypothetical protein